MLLDLMAHASTVASVIPDITPEQPPGTDGVLTLLNWISWIVIGLGLAGFMGSLGTLAFAAFTGGEVRSLKGLVIAIIVCSLATGVGGIMRVFI